MQGTDRALSRGLQQPVRGRGPPAGGRGHRTGIDAPSRGAGAGIPAYQARTSSAEEARPDAAVERRTEMVETIPQELELTLEELREQVAMLSARLASLEKTVPVAETAPAAPAPVVETRESITEEELLAISGALAAYLGVRVHIRQIR